MAIGDVYQLALRQSQNGRQVVNTFFFRMKTAPDPTIALIQPLADDFKNALRQMQVDDLSYVDWRFQQFRGAGTTYSTTAPFRVSTVSYTGTFTAPLAGARVNPPESQQVAWICSVNTALAGRRRKGRFFLGGAAEADVADNGFFDPTQVANLQGFILPLITEYGTGGTSTDFMWVQWSDRIAKNTVLSNTWPRVEVSAGAPNPADADREVVSITVRTRVGAQRDRRPK